MAAITALTKDFDGADGVAITTAAQIGASKLTGSGTSKFSAAHAITGTSCWELDCSGNNVIGEFAIGTSKALVWTTHYFTTPSALPSGSPETIYASKGDSDTNQAVSVRWMTDGGVQLRDNITARANSTLDDPANPVPLPPNTAARLDIKSQPGGGSNKCRAQLFIGSNIHGGTPDWDSGDQANSSSIASGVDTIWLGALTNQTGSMFIDYLRGNDSAAPGPAVTVGKPTVSAGGDQTRDVSSGNFTLNGTESTVGGATVSSRSWTQVNGPAVTVVSGASTATLTLTALAASGTAVFRYTVVDSNAQTNSDDVTVAFVVPGVALVPVGDFSNAGAFVTQAGGSTNLWQALDDGGSNLADFITTPQSPVAAEYRCRITPAVEPGNENGCVLLPTVAVTADATSYSFVYKLYDGDGTLKKTFTAITTGLSTTPTAVPLALTAAEIASFAHWDSGIIVGRTMTVG